MCVSQPSDWETFPPSLGREETALAAEMQTTHSAGAHFPPYWQLLSARTLEAWARRESKERTVCASSVSTPG